METETHRANLEEEEEKKNKVLKTHDRTLPRPPSTPPTLPFTLSPHSHVTSAFDSSNLKSRQHA